MGNFKAGFGAESSAPTAPTPEEISLLIDGELEPARADAVVTSLCRSEGRGDLGLLPRDRGRLRGVAARGLDSKAIRRAVRSRADSACAAAAITRAARDRTGAGGDGGGGKRRRLGSADDDADAGRGDCQRQTGGRRARGGRPPRSRQRVSAGASGILADQCDSGHRPLFARRRGHRAGCASVAPGARRQWSARLRGGIGARRRHAACRPDGTRPGRGRLAATRGDRRAPAELRRHHRLSARRPHRDVASLSPADAYGESEKLSNLDGPAREIIRNGEQVRCYYPEAKVIRVEPRSMHNAFPSLLPQQLATLATYYQFRKAEIARVAGLETQAYVFEPKDGLRYGHKLWADIATGLLLKARLLNERNEPVEQFAFSDIQIGVRLDRDATKPPFATVPPDWQVRESPAADIAPKETGWVVRDMPPGFTKIVEGFRTLRGKRGASRAHRLFGWAGRDFGVRRADAGDAAAGRPVAARRNQCLQPAARRLSGDGSGRSARRDRAPDRLFGRTPPVSFGPRLKSPLLAQHR